MDCENSDPGDGEDDDCFVVFNKPVAKNNGSVTTTTTTTTITVVTSSTPANRPVRICRNRVNLADVEHSAGSDDEERVLPNFQAASALPTDKEVVQLLLSLGAV
jgi:hypothetical protein